MKPVAYRKYDTQQQRWITYSVDDAYPDDAEPLYTKEQNDS